MACKYCGTNGLKDASDEELNKEIERREKATRVAKDAYVERMWPSCGRMELLNFFLIPWSFFVVAVSVDTIRELSASMGAFAEPLTLWLSIGLWLILLVPSMLIVSKKQRLLHEFREHHMHAETA